MLIAIGKAILECPCWTVAFRAGEMNPRWRADSLLLSFLIIAASAETLQLSAGLAVCYSRSSNNLTAFNISLLSTLDCWGKLKNIVAERRVQSAECRMQDAGCVMQDVGSGVEHLLLHQRLLLLRHPNDGLRWKCLKLTRAHSSNKSFQMSPMQAHRENCLTQKNKKRNPKPPAPQPCSILKLKTLLLILHESSLSLSSLKLFGLCCAGCWLIKRNHFCL